MSVGGFSSVHRQPKVWLGVLTAYLCLCSGLPMRPCSETRRARARDTVLVIYVGSRVFYDRSRVRTTRA